MEWISISVRVPKDFEDVLMTYNGLVLQGKYHSKMKFGGFYHPNNCCHVEGYCDCTYDDVQEGITHWMPLPEPPKE